MCDDPGMSSDAPPKVDLEGRLASLGTALGQRESVHADGLERARGVASALRDQIERALSAFHESVADAGAPHLRVDLSGLRIDDKHLRAIEFELSRGRYTAIVTAKSRGEVTLVGPFRTGKTEGPCLTFPFDAESEIQGALASFLERFLEEAATP